MSFMRLIQANFSLSSLSVTFVEKNTLLPTFLHSHINLEKYTKNFKKMYQGA